MTKQTALPILQKRSVLWSGGAVMIRVALLLVFGFCLRSKAVEDRRAQSEVPFTLDQLRQHKVNVDRLTNSDPGRATLLDRNGTTIGFAMTTQPSSDGVVGYRGRSHCAVVLDSKNRVQKAWLLSSEDTSEHVDMVRENSEFWQQFDNWRLSHEDSFQNVDTVSGATLTSLAIIEGIQAALGQTAMSLKFPGKMTVDDARRLFPDSDIAAIQPTNEGLTAAVSNTKTIVGFVLRTGPLDDTVRGYQGPSELLIGLNAERKVQVVVLRSTFDNQPYAGYLDDEPWYWEPFLNRSLSNVALLDLQEEGIEGVSGATMTSIAAAETLIAAADKWSRLHDIRQTANPSVGTWISLQWQEFLWTSSEVGTIAVVIVGCVIAFSRLKSSRFIRATWNLILIGYFGLMTGNLISLAVLSGWFQTGIAWQLAPGLTSVGAVSLLLPMITKRNVYCSHLCPHGAAQQLLRPKIRLVTKRKSRTVLIPWLKRATWIPGITLLLAALAVVFRPQTNLAAWEPFHAWIITVSGTSSLVLAGLSLLASRLEPMAYCRYGCATGRFLEYVRRSAGSFRPTLADAVICMLIIGAVCSR